MVWDNQDPALESAWAYPPNDPTLSPFPTPYPGDSFTTIAHPYPDPHFIWSPDPPAVGEVVEFTDNSVCFDADGICNSWFWEFGDGHTSTEQHPTHVFTDHVKHTVKLTVTDDKGFSCYITRDLTPTLPLPIWEEIPPFMWLPLEIPFVATVAETFKEFFTLGGRESSSKREKAINGFFISMFGY